MTKFFLFGVGLLFLGFLPSGCASRAFTNQVGISLIDVRPAGATLFETGVNLTLRVTNGSNQELRLTGSSHQLALNDSSVGRAVSDQVITVSPLGTTTVTVTAYLENLALLRKFGGGEQLQEVSYRLDSRLFIGGSSFATTVTTEGKLDLRPYLAALNR